MDDFAQFIYNENHNIISDGTMIYTQMKDSPQIEWKLQYALNSRVPWYFANNFSVSITKPAVM